jgi:hypothetical protein
MSTTVIRIRGSNPTLESGSSNLVFVLGTSETDASTDWSVLTLQNNRTVRDLAGSVVALQTTPFLVIKQTPDGALISSSRPGIDMGSLTSNQDAALRFCTKDGGEERARIDAQGLSCTQFTARSYIGLVDRYDAFDGFRPASANALANAYVDLSNMISTTSGISGISGNNSNPVTYTLVDSYVSTSITQAPTANALRTAYSALSNSVGADLYTLSNSVRTLVYNAVASTMSKIEGGGGGGGGGVALINNVDLRSTPDQQARLLVAAGGETVFKAAGNQNALGIDRMAFGWTVNDVDSSRMSLSGNGNLWVKGSLDVGSGTLSLRSNMRIGDVTLSAVGSNLGINLPMGAPPQHGLHVSGLIYSEEGVYALSDASAKSNLKPIEGALERLKRLRGYTYDLKGRHRMGLKAQEVREVAPEAVSEDANGCLSVAYGDLLALVVEALRELEEQR